MPNPQFTERLTPSPGMIAALLLSSPMVLLAAIPFSAWLAYLLAVAVPLGLIGFFIWRAPRIVLADGVLEAGRMRVPLEALGEAEHFRGEQARFERGPGLSPGAQVLFKGDIDAVVKIHVTDPLDPTNYLLLSTRKGEELVSALRTHLS